LQLERQRQLKPPFMALMKQQPCCLRTISTEWFYQQQNFLIARPLNDITTSAKPMNKSTMSKGGIHNKTVKTNDNDNNREGNNIYLTNSLALK
jgi:hypothetical protein